VTLIRKLSIKSKRSQNPGRTEATTFWNPKISNGSYAKLKSSLKAKPKRQEPVEKAGKVRFLLFSAFNVCCRQGHCKRRFSLWLSTRTFPFAASLISSHLKKYVCFLLTPTEFIRILSNSQIRNMTYNRLSKEKQALVLSALREGTPVRAVARMFKTGKGTITRVIRETGEAFVDYTDLNFRAYVSRWTNNGSTWTVILAA